jgi:hypothetical protein
MNQQIPWTLTKSLITHNEPTDTLTNNKSNNSHNKATNRRYVDSFTIGAEERLFTDTEQQARCVTHGRRCNNFVGLLRLLRLASLAQITPQSCS